MARPQVLNAIDQNESNINKNALDIANLAVLIKGLEEASDDTNINITSILDSLVAAHDSIEDLYSKVNSFISMVEVSSITSGSIFYLEESGILVPYIKMLDNYDGSTYTTVLRKNILTIRPIVDMNDAAFVANQRYKDSAINTWLDSVFLNTLGATVKAVIPNTMIDTLDDDYVSTSCKVFLPSRYELNLSISYQYLGQSASYFDSNAKRVATYNGVPTLFYTREINNANRCSYIDSSGAAGDTSYQIGTTPGGIRPSFRLPPTFKVPVVGPDTSNILAEATLSS